MSYPPVLDLRRGIKNWLPLGNLELGDCTIAAYEHINMVHNLATSSWWKRLAYRAGYRPPSNQYAISEYTAFLITQHQQPNGTAGVDPSVFLAWEQQQGRITEWQTIDVGTRDKNTIIRQAISDWDGVMIGLELTKRAYDLGVRGGPWVLETGDTPEPNLTHAIAGVGYGPKNNIIVTWGVAKQMSIDFTNATVYECWAWR